ncbi:MAG: efflux RND transporter periplasmic adaptor subunit [Pseudomonadota bacterium]
MLRMGLLMAMLSMGQVALAQSALVKLYEVQDTGTGIERTFFGRVVARETVDLAFQVAGQIVEFPLEEGADVAQGALVAELDLLPFELSLAEAQAGYDQAKRTYDRFQKLSGNTVSQASLDDTKTQVDLTEIAVRDAKRALNEARLQSPFEAIVAARLVPNFSTIDAGTPIVRLHDMSELRIEIDVPERLAQQAGPDPDVAFLAEFSESGRSYPLTFREFNAETASVGQTYTITLGMPPPEDLAVLPGASAMVHATIDTGQSRILIPASAVRIGNDGSTSVLVFEPAGAAEGTVSLAAVEVTPTPSGAVAVLSGLTEGQEIVATGVAALEDGATVRRFTGFTN